MERSQELVDAYNEATSSLNHGASLEVLLSSFPDVSVIGTDPNDWLVGRDAVGAALGQLQEVNGVRFERTAGEPVAWTAGETGWIIDRPMYSLPGGPSAQVRTTIICHRENGVWKVVHQHTSIGIPTEAMPKLLEMLSHQ